MVRLVMLAVIILTSASTEAAAQEEGRSIIGAGTVNSCGQWTSRPGSGGDILSQWVAGYLSGLALGATTATDFLIRGSILKFNPDLSFAQAKSGFVAMFRSASNLINKMLALPCLALSCLVLPCLVLPCLVLPCVVLSCLALPCLVLPCHACDDEVREASPLRGSAPRFRAMRCDPETPIG